MSRGNAVRELERGCDGILARLIGLATRQRRARRPQVLPGAVSLVGSGVLGRVEQALQSGDRESAIGEAQQQFSTLCSSDQGLAMLEVLGLAPESVRLPSGKLNLLQLSHRLSRGELGLDGLARLLQDAGWRLHTEPDALLLCFSAAREVDPACASRFLARYLTAHGLPRCLAWRGGETKHGGLDGFVWHGLPHRVGPLVSVLVPARNAAQTLIAAIDSLLAQSYRSLEVLVGDDASDDDTAGVLAARYAGEPRVRRFRSRTQQGAYNLKNALFRHARGTLLAFHDADDVAFPFRLAAQIARLEQPGVVACLGDGVRIRPGGEVVYFRDQRATRLSTVSLLVRREVFAAVGGFRRARFGADYELFTRLCVEQGVNAIARLRAPLILSLWSPASTTRQIESASLEDGYRSPARRAYQEAVLQRYVERANVPDARIQRLLMDTGNYPEPSEIVEL